jgi:MFS transporter, DHA3 family, tetracycline resistance protein
MKKLPAETIYYIRSAVWEFNSGLIFTSIWVLYYSVMKLNLFEISLISIVITLSNVVLEVPTGILADVYSRRLSVVLGGIFIGLAYVMMGAYPIFAIALMCGFIEAIGDTCVSGALQAWITDEVGTGQVSRVFLRGRQVSIPAHWIGVVLSIALAAWFNCQIPIILGGTAWFALTIFLVLFMPETNFQCTSMTTIHNGEALLSQFRATRNVFADGMRLVRNSRILLLLFLAQLFSRAFFDSFYKFSRANILQGFLLPIITLPILGVLKENVWFGILEMLQGLFGFIGMEGVRRYIDLNRTGIAARVLLGFQVLMLVGLFVFAFTGNLVLAIVAWLIVNGFQDIGIPITETWLNQNIPSSIRSTVLSMNSQVGMLGQMGGSTGLGMFGDRFGVRNMLGLSGVFLVPLLVMYGRNTRLLAKPGQNS